MHQLIHLLESIHGEVLHEKVRWVRRRDADGKKMLNEKQNKEQHMKIVPVTEKPTPLTVDDEVCESARLFLPTRT
jgi:hypothetical protein